MTIAERLRAHYPYAGLPNEAADEIDRLLKAANGWEKLFREGKAEIERLRKALRDQAGVELSEENDRLIDEIERLKKVIDATQHNAS